MAGKWFDGLAPGQVFDHAIRRTVTETDNLLFSAMTHPAQLQRDEEYCRDETEFGRRIVTVEHRACNQHDVLVARCLRSGLRRRRPVAA